MTASEAILSLLEERGKSASICPSEAARRLAGDGETFRDRMAEVHQAVDDLHVAGTVNLSWKGAPLGQRSGPYRITRA